MTNRSTWRALIVLTFLLSVTGIVQSDPPEESKSRADEFLAFARREAAAHTFHVSGSDRPLKLEPDPILKWSNPIVGEIYGGDFLCTSNGGRPLAFWSLHRWYSAQTHEAHEAVEYLSLTTDRIVAEKNGQTVWAPSRPGIEMKPIPEAPIPTASPAQRLRQMRELAKEFTGRQTSRDGVDRDIRLLTQPIYRYEDAKSPVIDGGLFAFVQGTDPEVLLLIEARQADGKPHWQYGLARMTSIELRVSHRGRPVWSVPVITWAQVEDRREPYMSFVMR
jgi:hypothetical protein